MGLLMMKYLVAISFNTLIIGVQLCWMHVWTCFLVEKSQYRASLISFLVFCYICKYLGSNSIQVAKFWDVCHFRGKKHVNDIFFLQRYLMFNVDISTKKVLLGIFLGCELWDDVCPVAADVAHEKPASWCVCCDLPVPGWAGLLFQLSQPHEVLVTCAFHKKRLQVMKSVLFLGRGNLHALVVGQDLCWFEVTTWPDCHEQTLLTEESRCVLSVIWV